MMKPIAVHKPDLVSRQPRRHGSRLTKEAGTALRLDPYFRILYFNQQNARYEVCFMILVLNIEHKKMQIMNNTKFTVFWKYRISQPIRCSMIFLLEILEKNNDECILILLIYWKKTVLLHTKISDHNIIYSP